MIKRGQIQSAMDAESIEWAYDATALKIAAALQLLPELRGLWAFSSVNESGNIIDLSGQGRTLTNNGTATRAILPSGLPYAIYNGSTQYFSRADEAGLDITGALTIGGWFYAAALADVGLIGKFAFTAGNYKSYLLRILDATGAIRFTVSADGSASVAINTATGIATGSWHFIAGRFTPSTEIAVFVDGVKTVNTTSIPASLYNSNQPLQIGAYDAGTKLFTGRSAPCFLSAAAIPDDLLYAHYAMARPLLG